MAAVPRVSIGVPVFNAERYLPAALDALLAQEYRDYEIVICDNASTDGTWDICRRYADREPRIRLHRNPENLGGHVNYARVLQLARGELFKWAAYDDLCLPAYLGGCVATLDAAGPRAVLAYPRAMLIDDTGAEIGPYDDGLDLRDPRPWRRVARAAARLSLCHVHFGVFRTAVLRRTGLIRPYLSSDYTLVAEVAQLGEIHEVPQRLFLRRLHSGSTRQAGYAVAAAVSWFAPAGNADAADAPRRRMLVQTARVLATADTDPFTRVSCAAAFLAAWLVRRARVRLGRWRRRVPPGLPGTPARIGAR